MQTSSPTMGGMAGAHPVGDRYKWTALSNTTLGVFLALLNSSIVIISLPAIFRGIHLDPLQPSNIGYLLWLLQGYLVVTAVLVVTFGRIGDIFGRVRMYNLGFVIFTLASIGLALVPNSGPTGAMELIIVRVVQGVGGAMLMANSSAIITDAFPAHERGMALGINVVAAITGSFLGLLVGGLLADTSWRLVFLISVPIGIFGTVWAYLKLRDLSPRINAPIDWWGNLTLAVGLVAIMVGITYGIQPYGGHSMGWTSPVVLAELVGGLALLVIFAFIETRVADPMIELKLFRIKSFANAGLANFLSSMGRGGLQFMLIIWLQGIWLPLHGYSFASTPLWAGIYMIPLSVGFLASGPAAGWLSDRYGPRLFASGGMALCALSFFLLMALPTNFSYPVFAALLLINGLGTGAFAAPNSSTIMNSVPAGQRGAASGIRATFMNSGMVLSIGIFFSLMIAGLAAHLPHDLYQALVNQGVPAGAAHRAAQVPPVGSLFAAFLGYNPIKSLLGPHVLAGLPHHSMAYLTGKQFFPHVISRPFHQGLLIAFGASALMVLGASVASWKAGGKYVHVDKPLRSPVPLVTVGDNLEGGGEPAQAGAGTPEPDGSAPWAQLRS
ncbi:MAG: MFS transporter [Acidimicrobiales bacterium]